jgi:hypothetical protein
VKACWRRYAWSCATSGKFGRDDEDEHEQKCGAQHDRAGAGAGGHGHEDGDAQRAADLMGRVDQPGGGAGVLIGGARDAGGGNQVTVEVVE